MQAKQMELFPKSKEEREQELFLQILHHDAVKRGGFFARFDMLTVGENNQVKTKWASKTSSFLMTTDSTYNRYIALNTFHRKDEEIEMLMADGTVDVVSQKTRRRKETHLHAVTSIYIDLDFHDGTIAEAKERTQNSKKLLKQTYQDGILPKPTMVTETGRGLGVYYVLDKSIANTEKTAKQLRFWDYLCKELSQKYDELLKKSDQPQLEIDAKVIGDVTRVVRLPGTLNLKTYTTCRLISVARNADGQPLYYSLKELANYIENYNVYPESSLEDIRKELAKNKIISFSEYNKPALVGRIKKLERVQELVIHQRESCRELLCFYFYNTAVQLMDPQEAFEKMLAFNSRFDYPITDQNELNNIVRSVSQATDLEGNPRGYFEYKDITIKETLKLTEEQNAYVGFCISKASKRQAEKEKNQKIRNERNERIVKYVIENPDETYEDIADLFGVSVRTLKNILKTANVYRYQIQERKDVVCGTLNEDNIENASNIINFEDQMNKTEKVQKNAPVSNGVLKYILNNYRDINTTSYLEPSNKLPVKELEPDRFIRVTEKQEVRCRSNISVFNSVKNMSCEEDDWVFGDYDWVFK